MASGMEWAALIEQRDSLAELTVVIWHVPLYRY